MRLKYSMYGCTCVVATGIACCFFYFERTYFMDFHIVITLTFYLLVATCLISLSSKASVYVDLIDKKTSLSGAFIGGVMLSAVTSLPELFTSLTSAVLLNKPGLAMGNILGSNLFNLTLISCLIIFFLKPFSKVTITKGHFMVALFSWLMFGAIYLNYKGIVTISLLTISLTSMAIMILYVCGIRSLSQEESAPDAAHDSSALTIKQVMVRFACIAVGIVCLSVLLTYLTDGIATTFNLGNGLAGALFLGIATSLPELASSVALFRMGNYNIALGNIIGSNLFNFMILSITDVVYLGHGIYDFSDPKTVNLLIFGMIATPLFLLMSRCNRKWICIITSLGTVACYIAFLAV